MRPTDLITSITQLVPALFDAHHDADRMFEALATCLTANLCDGCAIAFEPGTGAPAGVTRDRGDAAHVARFPLRGRELSGQVVVTRDGGSGPFDGDAMAAISTCIEFASLAAEGALDLEIERHAMQSERERTAKFQREMLGIVGHDLRGPLAAIMMSTEILSTSSNEDTSAANAVTRIVSFTNRMKRMVDQLLELMRARLGGQIALSRSPMKLLPALEAVIEHVTTAHPTSRFEVSGGDARGIWDSDRISQALFNVLENAVQFGRARATIHIRVTHSDAITTIAIHNELREAPMSPETLATLFEPYRRGWDREHIGTGLGLGLYLAREIVRAHRGSIAVDSSSSGTTFQIALPDS